jgi:hypothetical protein
MSQGTGLIWWADSANGQKRLLASDHQIFIGIVIG